MYPESTDHDEDLDAEMGFAPPTAGAGGDGTSADNTGVALSPGGLSVDSVGSRVDHNNAYYARWNDDMLSSTYDISTLPTAARLLVVLTAVNSIGEERRLAVVALSLFDEARRLRRGRWAMRMFHCTQLEHLVHSSAADGMSGKGGADGGPDKGEHSDHSDGERRKSSVTSPGRMATDPLSGKSPLLALFPYTIVCGMALLLR